tara:strand:- start:115 stop:435 length:321 start_codon:yes stop_codon:yes gene_type:complete
MTIKRKVATNTDSMSTSYAYTTAGRGSLPTTLTCRVQPLSGRERQEYATTDVEYTDAIYTTTDPQIDERDQLVEGTDQWDDLVQVNVHTMSRFWKILGVRRSSGVE